MLCRWATRFFIVLIPLLAACGDRSAAGSRVQATAPALGVPAPETSPGAAAPSSTLPLVAFLGDSLTAGLGLSAEQSYPALLETRMREAGEPIRVLNAGVSGDTTAGGVRRLSWILAQHPAVVVVGLGANDALRAQPVAEIEANLRQLIAGVRAAGARPVLLGMKIPPNYGPDYSEAFAAVYPKLAHELAVPLVPFLLEGVGGDAALNQADGIHPTAEGQRIVASNVLPVLRQVVSGLESPKNAVRRSAAGGR
jgi:acyl-CoA thioesterase I